MKKGSYKNIARQQFGNLTALERDFQYMKEHNTKKNYWKCQCSCGNFKTVYIGDLTSGNTKSCGCLKSKGLQEYNQKSTQEHLIPSGTRFGKLVILEPIGYRPQYNGAKKNRMWYKCQCDCGNTCEKNGNMLKNGQVISCEKCKVSSKGELLVLQLLNEANINYKKEVVFPELLKETGRRLRFDFVLYNDKNKVDRIIEFDGRQHYTGPDTPTWSRTNETLETIQEKDTLKNNFCIKHNYLLIRIPYYKVKNLKLDDLLSNKYLIKGDDFS